jgi:F-type H+-transporting ATPase subunit delta
MKLSKDARILSRELFRLCLVNGKVENKRVHQVVEALLSKRPRYYLQILRELTRLIRLNLAHRQAKIYSALPLSSIETAQIKKELHSLRGEDLEIQFKVNPTLLGGLYIKIGSDVWDGSIQNRLRRILATKSPSEASFFPTSPSQQQQHQEKNGVKISPS